MCTPPIFQTLHPSLRAFAHAIALWAALALLTACTPGPWNNPYPASEEGGNILYSAFVERPKHLDPVQSYSEDESVFTAQIYEAPLQYHYLKRPYTLIPATAAHMPEHRYRDAQGRLLPDDAPASQIAYTDYHITLKPGIRYQPHPAFAPPPPQLEGIHRIGDFPQTGTRLLRAEDYVYQIKRLAHPKLHSPIFGLMSEYIVGLDDLAQTLKKAADTPTDKAWLDLREFPLAGVQAEDDLHYRIRIKGKYPQFLYWLTMPFFAPIPWEADQFYARDGMAQKNLTLDWYPVGTGPYMLTENNPNSRMTLTRNPHFRGEPYPCEGEPEDRTSGLLDDCGKIMPFIDKAVFTREKEQIPFWNKFLQGYYDASGISSDTFDQTVQTSVSGDIALSDDMQARGISLSTSIATSTFYLGFNMLDPVVGGTSARSRALRQAISVAIDQDEYISIFQNGRGVPGQSPLPPGIFGYREGEAGLDPVTYRWHNGKPQRQPIEEARRLLAQAGYPNGRDAQTGQALVIHLDTTPGSLGAKSRIDWLDKQFRKINVQLDVRSTDYNRFQDKVRQGSVQLYFYGWNGDYPDPENFYFLLYGPQSKVRASGENASNYANPAFDRLFEQMRSMDNGPQRQRIIDQMNAILHEDAPWLWMMHPKDFSLRHAWVYNRKPIKVGNNTLKYARLDPALRERQRRQWNKPQWAVPLGIAGAILALLLWVWRTKSHTQTRSTAPARGQDQK
jgi:oligopeptide transport system substrate-binding protein